MALKRLSIRHFHNQQLRRKCNKSAINNQTQCSLFGEKSRLLSCPTVRVHDLVRVKTNGRNVKAFYEFFPSYGDASSLDADGDGGV